MNAMTPIVNSITVPAYGTGCGAGGDEDAVLSNIFKKPTTAEFKPEPPALYVNPRRSSWDGISAKGLRELRELARLAPRLGG